MSSADIPSWDAAVRGYTNNFTADGTTIRLTFSGEKATGKAFTVSRAVLAHWSPVFKDMFSAASVAFQLHRQDRRESTPILTVLQGRGDSVLLHNDANEFEEFLWFIHVDPLSFADYMANCAAPVRFDRALGIAAIAHFYDAAKVTQWAIGELLQYMSACTTPILLPRLHHVAHACRDVSQKLHDDVMAQWRSAIDATQDPVWFLVATKKIKDEQLQARAYFAILSKMKIGQIADERRLTTLDRLRLLLGATTLRRYEATKPLNQFQEKERDWFPRLNLAPRDMYGDRSLWDMFTRSDIGIVLKDEAQVEHLALRP